MSNASDVRLMRDVIARLAGGPSSRKLAIRVIP